MSTFAHLHLHSEFSFLDGIIRRQQLIDKVLEYGWNTASITDHGVMINFIKFYDDCLKNGVKPILGVEAYQSRGPRSEKRRATKTSNNYHLTVIAKNLQGYNNLCQLMSCAAEPESYYYKPRIDYELLERYHEGLIILSGCLGGELNQAIMNGDEDIIAQHIGFFKNVFGDDYYLEYMYTGAIDDNGHEVQPEVNLRLQQLGEKFGIRGVITGDCHYLTDDDYDLHEITLCMSMSKKRSDKNRLIFERNYHIKNMDELKDAAANGNIPDHAFDGVRDVINKIEHYGLEKYYGTLKFDWHGSEDPRELLTRYCKANMAFIDVHGRINEYEERLEKELTVINGLGFAPYFITLANIVEQAKDRQIMVGPGRGSAAGSLVSYLMGITKVDPIEHGLIFERFLNAEIHDDGCGGKKVTTTRISPPDIDVDFEQARRQEVIELISELDEGNVHVYHIGTYNYSRAKQIMGDVGVSLEIDRFTAQGLTKRLHDKDTKISFVDLLEKHPEVKNEMDSINPEWYGLCEQADGLPKSIGCHASGIIVSREPIEHIIPLASTGRQADHAQTGAKIRTLVTSYDMHECEQLGLLKLDILGLRTLDVINNTLKLIEKHHGRKIDIWRLHKEQESLSEVYKMMYEGNTEGIFQVVTDSFRKAIIDLKPDSFELLTAINAITRPGCTDSGTDKIFINRRHGRESVTYYHESVESVLKPTFGIMLYQEQIMAVAKILASYTDSQADELRKGIGKKIKEEVDKHEQSFKTGCMSNGHSAQLADMVWDHIKAAARYSWNKSHAVSYTLITLATAWLKKYYPSEFWASMLSTYAGDSEKTAHYIAQAKLDDVKIDYPDINESEIGFTLVDGRLLFGLDSINKVGPKSVKHIIEERTENGPFVSYSDFFKRVTARIVNKTQKLALVKAGAFDNIYADRDKPYDVIRNALVNIHCDDRFCVNNYSDPVLEYKNLKEKMDAVPLDMLLQHELSSFGINIKTALFDKFTAHTGCNIKEMRKFFKLGSIDTEELEDGDMIMALVHIDNVEYKTSKKGNRYTVITITDHLNRKSNIMMWPSFTDQISAAGIEGKFMFLLGQYTEERINISLLIDAEDFVADLHLRWDDVESIPLQLQLKGAKKGIDIIQIDSEFFYKHKDMLISAVNQVIHHVVRFRNGGVYINGKSKK